MSNPYSLHEFLKMKPPKEKSSLWKAESLPTLDFGQKKYLDFGSNDKKDDCKIESSFGGEQHYLE